MKFFEEFTTSQIAISCLVSWLASQFLKGTILCVINRKFSFKFYLAQEGGMPSSHSALVSALFFSVYFLEGMSTAFSVSLIFGLITLRDAMGVRQAVSQHAKILNKLIEQVIGKDHEQYTILRELLGHNFLEVMTGVIIAYASVEAVFYYFP